MVQYFVALVQSLMTREDEGQGLVEYGLILALIAVVCVAALTLIGGNVSTMLETLAGELS